MPARYHDARLMLRAFHGSLRLRELASYGLGALGTAALFIALPGAISTTGEALGPIGIDGADGGYG